MVLARKTSAGVTLVQRRRYLPAQSNLGVCCTPEQAGQISIVADMKASGVNWVRFDAYWYYIEQPKGAYDWTVLDAAVNTVFNAGLTPLVVIHTTARWAQPAGTDIVTYGPVGATAVAGFAEFCAKIAQRYGHKIGAYEIWNEANLDQFWTPTPSVSAYLAAASAASYAIKQVDPTLVVISQGIGGAGPAPDIDVNTWLAAFYAQGGARWFDGIAVHSYSVDAGLYEVTRAAYYMNLNNDLKPIWLTETGYPTGGTPSTTESQQAILVAATPANFAAASLAGGVFCFFNYQDGDSSSADREMRFGVIRRSTGVIKPARAQTILAGAKQALNTTRSSRFPPGFGTGPFGETPFGGA